VSLVTNIMAEVSGGATPAEKKGKSQPTKRLPTERIKFQKQLDIIRAYGIRSDNGTRPANYREVGEDVGIHPNTISLLVGFLVENGFLDRVGNETIPTKPVLDFVQAHNWAPENAPRKLAPIIRKSWFGEILLRKLRFRSLPEEEALAELAGNIGAGPDFKAQIGMLLDYAVAAGLARRDGAQLALGEEALVPSGEAAAAPVLESGDVTSRDERSAAPTRQTAAVSTGFMTTEGMVQFHVDIRVTMKEMAGWTPDRIAAFFSGLAQVLAAKKGAEDIKEE
jgi:hypothetical protein